MSALGFDESLLLERPPIPFDESVLRPRFRGARVLVTGAGGSIGSLLVDLLLELGAEAAVCAESHEPSLHRLGLRLRERYPAGRVVLRLADVRHTDRMARLIRDGGVDAVFHMAAYKHVPLAEENCDQVVAVNILASLDLADAAAALGMRDYIYPSTDKAVRPPSIYGATKRLVEIELTRRAAADPKRGIGVARLVNVFGTAGNVIERWLSQLRAGEPLSVTDDRMTRYWISSREAALFLASCACLPRGAEPLLPEVGEPVPLMRTAERLAAVVGRAPTAIHPIGPRPGERLHEELTYSHERLEPSGLPGIRRVSSERAPDDVRAAVALLRAAVAEGDDRRARAVLLEAVHATVPVG